MGSIFRRTAVSRAKIGKAEVIKEYELVRDPRFVLFFTDRGDMFCSKPGYEAVPLESWELIAAVKLHGDIQMKLEESNGAA